ncbi:peroxiredoxin [Nocardioides marmorisolisilvae]|uniref:Alkyl hydroperoxide reductase E n=1 Tax=Nocardioides marmorisolisilvae TaxID=1542737 RepID=A0A3N0DTT2_9ACTN|nr:peroxiredoxin [Nocardioides marmorisolisilvae]RNL78921.1 peroxiredoxin [Nocardioides marmorisolisilvae]
MPLQVGDHAPDFALRDQHGAEFKLSSVLGEKAVLLVFFPFAFSGVCTGELTGFRDRLGEFETDDTTLVAISCDSVYTQRAVADRDGLFFPLLADYWPHGEVASAYGVFDAEQGCPTRSSFVVDKAGRIAWSVHNQMGEARDLDTQATHLRQAV